MEKMLHAIIYVNKSSNMVKMLLIFIFFNKKDKTDIKYFTFLHKKSKY